MRRRTLIILVLGFALVSASIYHHVAQRGAAAKRPVEKKAVSMKFLKKKAVVPTPAVVNTVTKKTANPTVAIVIDDFGYNKNNLAQLFSIGEAVTLSILPGLSYSAKIAQLARDNGCEAILHLPLEPHRRDVREEQDTIRSGMSGNDISERIERELGSVPGVRGVSNHMGSKSTEDRALMSVIFGELKKRRLYFFDSLTSEQSVCGEIAREMGLKYAKRDIFLDNSTEMAAIEKQLSELERLAFQKGHAIAVCHDRNNTIAALAAAMPRMARDGVRFVKLSEAVR
jgi:polysaccharide deacetylase 2 family uncharacterized protein YibQ